MWLIISFFIFGNYTKKSKEQNADGNKQN